MIFTIYYMYATILQWWRLGALKHKLNGTLCAQNALLVCNGTTISTPSHRRCLENLLIQNNDRIICTVVPRQNINLSHWVAFPKDFKYFPIHISAKRSPAKVDSMHYILIASKLDNFIPHSGDVVEIEQFGELLAWKASQNFEIILKTDMENITKLVYWFSNNNLDINHELELLKIELVDVHGSPSKIKYDTKYTLEQTLKYSLAPVHWEDFVGSVRDLYSKLHSIQPKICIENGTNRKIPVSEVKPMKKEVKKKVELNKNTLEVQHSSKRKDREHHKNKDLVKTKEKELNSVFIEEVKVVEDVVDECNKLNGNANSAELHNELVISSEADLEKVVEVIKLDDNVVPKLDEGKLVEEVLSLTEFPELVPASSSATHVFTEPTIETIETTESSSANIVPTLENTIEESVAPRKSNITPKLRLTQAKDDAKVSTRDAKAKVTKEAKVVKEEKTAKLVKEEKMKTAKELDKSVKVVKEDSKVSKDSKEVKAGKDDKVKTSKDDKAKTSKDIKVSKDDKVSKEEKAKALKEEKAKEEKAKRAQKEKEERERLEKARLEKEQKKLGRSKEKKKELLTTISPSKQSVRSYSEAAQTSTSSTAEVDATKTESASAKPTNILVYAESTVAKENVKSVLQTILNNEKYIIYDLPTNSTVNSWKSSTNLVIVCGNVNPNLTAELLQYLVNGGQLLCLCSDLLYSVLQTFSTAEVREHELVRFSYGEWKRVKMMHHVFCYQASPAKKQFSKDSDQSGTSNGSSPIAPRTPAIVEIQHAGKTFTIQVQVLGSEETWQTPSLMLATVKSSSGKAFFSQVHLEVDPTQYQDDENKYAALKDSNVARLEILRDILTKHLDIDCKSAIPGEVIFTPAYFLGTFDFKMDLLKNNEFITDNILINNKLTIEFCGNNQEPGIANVTRLPVMVHSCPSNFSTIEYFENLCTKDIGRLVIYSDILSSTQYLLEKQLRHGFVVITRHQTQGIGRSNNVWLSPNGCCTFSMQIHVALSSNLGQVLSLIQHLITVAIVDAVKTLPGYENLDIGIKWPNDIYASKQIKLGGVLVTSTIYSNLAVLNIGCGINLDNTDPTTCINELIRNYNQQNNTNLKELSYEKFLALVFSKFEILFDKIQSTGTEELFPLYYKHWLHSDAEITVKSSTGETKLVKIVGIDQYGFLEIISSTGEKSSVQSDGNSFDMLNGLIAPKIF